MASLLAPLVHTSAQPCSTVQGSQRPRTSTQAFSPPNTIPLSARRWGCISDVHESDGTSEDVEDSQLSQLWANLTLMTLESIS